jgi:hypothetical protein
MVKSYRQRKSQRSGGACAADRVVPRFQHQVEPDAAETAERYGVEMPVPDLHARLVCGGCGSGRVDMVVTGTERQ